MNKISYNACVVCGSKAIEQVLVVKDHSVSGEPFGVWECQNCSVRFTQDIPDQDEIGRYYQSADYISHSDTKKGLINFLYHTVRKRTLQYKRKLIAKYTGLQKGSIIDIGCGTGAFLHTMQACGWDAVGFEPDEGARIKAKDLYRLDVQEPDKLFALNKESIDVITLWHVLEHVHDLHGYMKQLFSLLKPGGKLFIAVPNYTSYDEFHYGAHWAGYDVPRHLYHFSPKAIKHLLQQYNFTCTTLLPMWYDSFYVSMLSEKYTPVKRGVLGAMCTGIKSNYKAYRNNERCCSLIYVATKANEL